MKVWMIGAGALLVASLSGCIESESHSEKMARTCGTPAQAYQQSTAVVSQHLRAPSTAEFPGSVMDRTVEYDVIDECTTVIRAHVDAQNGFGAMIRSNYTVTISYSRASDSWSYTGLTID